MSRSYLAAAREVLHRYGGAMHYESITTAAIRLKLLPVGSKGNPRYMAQVLNRSLGQSAPSDFRRVRPGVFELAEDANEAASSTEYAILRQRIQHLCCLCASDEITLLRRALWIAKKCASVGGSTREVVVNGTTVPLDPTGLATAVTVPTRSMLMRDRETRGPLVLSRSLRREYRALGSRLGTDLRATINFTISLFEVLLNQSDTKELWLTLHDGSKERLYI